MKRDELGASWGRFPELPIGKPGYPLSPYNFLHRDHQTYYPTDAERDAAIARLPYLASEQFIKQFKDTRKDAVFTFIRRPNYYAAFNSGERITDQQRRGLGLLWHPKTGAVLQSQTGSADHAWGTRAEGAEQVYEAGDVAATFSDDLAVATYPLGTVGKKTVTFEADAIVVRIEHPGAFTEQIPVVVRSDRRPRVDVRTPEGTNRSIAAGRTAFGNTSVETLNLSAHNTLSYTIQIRTP